MGGGDIGSAGHLQHSLYIVRTGNQGAGPPPPVGGEVPLGEGGGQCMH